MIWKVNTTAAANCYRKASMQETDCVAKFSNMVFNLIRLAIEVAAISNLVKIRDTDRTRLKIGCYGTPLGYLGIPVIKNFKENFNNWDAPWVFSITLFLTENSLCIEQE